MWLAFAMAVPLVDGLLVVACTFPDYTFSPEVINAGASLTSGTLTSAGGSSVGGPGGAGGAEGGTVGGATATTATAEGTGSNTDGTLTSSVGGTAGVTRTTGNGGTTSVSTTGVEPSTTDGAGGSGGERIDAGSCRNDQLCLSEQCDAGQCRPGHCGNGELDENESDVDCGGPDCRQCAYGSDCQEGSDCASGLCEANDECGATLRVRCTCNALGDCDTEPEQLNIDLQFDNVGPESVELSELSIYYYYSQASAAADTIACLAVNLQAGSCDNLDLQILADVSSDPSANRALRYRFLAGVVPQGGMSGAVHLTIEGSGPYERDDDYSFAGVPTDSSNFVLCDRVVVTDAYGVTIWGQRPAP